MKLLARDSLELPELVAVSTGHVGVWLWHAARDMVSRWRLVNSLTLVASIISAWLRE